LGCYLLTATQFFTPAQPLHLLPQRRRPALPTGIIEDLPDADQRRQRVAPVGRLPRPALLLYWGHRRMRQLADQNLAVQPRSLPRLVQQPRLGFLARFPILF